MFENKQIIVKVRKVGGKKSLKIFKREQCYVIQCPQNYQTPVWAAVTTKNTTRVK